MDSLPSEPPGKPYGNKSTPKKVSRGQVRGNIIRCFTNFWFPKFKKKNNIRLTGGKKREGCKRIFVLVGVREHEKFQEVKTESRRLTEGLETTRKEAKTETQRTVLTHETVSSEKHFVLCVALSSQEHNMTQISGKKKRPL